METIVILQNAWFFLIGVLFLGYAILDGFDLGVGMLLPFLGKKEKDKEILIKSVWPFWDGNEVWLLTAGGALFAAFPHAYATVFSGFYLALMLVLFALIFRAVSMEFWHYDEPRKKMWQWAFTIGSALPALLFGVALGNVVLGVPLDSAFEFRGTFFTLLRPFPLATGLLGFSAILIQGAAYIVLKTEGDLKERAEQALNKLWIVFIVLFGLALVLAIIYMPNNMSKIAAWFATIIVIGAWAGLKVMLKKKKEGSAFLMSSVLFAGLWGIAGSCIYPNLVTDIHLNLVTDVHHHMINNSITIFNGSSSQLTLSIMLVFALIGMPIVIGYTAFVYRAFKGKISE
ncbi:MAG: cytochrome d ubiquinol oxidase subunit II [bacterium]|nr:cytochrome d ubiquinol oxidase subunit II [bacterium]